MKNTMLERAEKLGNSDKRFMLKSLGECITHLNHAQFELLSEVTRLDAKVKEYEEMTKELVKSLTKQDMVEVNDRDIS